MVSFTVNKMASLANLFTLNQYCLLWDFKCPQIKLISIIQKPKTNHNKHYISFLVYVLYSMFALLEFVCEPTLPHQTAPIKPLQKCGLYMPMAVLIWVTTCTDEISISDVNRHKTSLAIIYMCLKMYCYKCTC